MFFRPIVSRSGEAYHVRGKESRYNGHRNDDRIKEVVRHLQGYSKGSDDEGKFPDLGERETGLHGNLQGLAGKQYAASREKDLPDQDKEGQDKDGHDVFPDDAGVYHHTH